MASSGPGSGSRILDPHRVYELVTGREPRQLLEYLASIPPHSRDIHWEGINLVGKTLLSLVSQRRSATEEEERDIASWAELARFHATHGRSCRVCDTPEVLGTADAASAAPERRGAPGLLKSVSPPASPSAIPARSPTEAAKSPLSAPLQPHRHRKPLRTCQRRIPQGGPSSRPLNALQSMPSQQGLENDEVYSRDEQESADKKSTLQALKGLPDDDDK